LSLVRKLTNTVAMGEGLCTKEPKQKSGTSEIIRLLEDSRDIYVVARAKAKEKTNKQISTIWKRRREKESHGADA